MNEKQICKTKKKNCYNTCTVINEENQKNDLNDLQNLSYTILK